MDNLEARWVCSEAQAPVCSDQMAIHLTPQEKIQSLLNQVIHLIENGALGELEGTRLVTSLGAATEKLNQEEIGAVADVLEGFVKTVGTKVKSGKLTPAEGLVLVKAALNVLVE